MAIELSPDEIDEMPQQSASTVSNSTILPTDPSDPGINTTPRPPVALKSDDVDSLPPGLMRKSVVDPSQTMAVANPKGLIEPGTLPIWNRPTVQNADGSHSSELSFSREDDDGHEVLVPVIVNGKFLTDDGKMPPMGHADKKTGKYIPTPEEKAMQDRAWEHYEQAGEHLGKFKDPDSADAYANILHNRGSAKSQEELANPKAKPSLEKALKDLDEFHAVRGVHGTQFTSASGREHRVGDRVSVNGHTGRIVRKHEVSGLPEIEWDK